MPQVIPVVIGVAAKVGSTIAAIGATKVIGGLTVGALTKAAFVGGSIIYSSSQARKAKRAARAELNRGQKVMFRDTASPRAFPYGEVPLSGPITFWHQTGDDGEYHHIILTLAGWEIQCIDTVYFDETALTLDGSGNVTNTKWAGFARIKKHLGTASQAVDSDLLSACSDVIDSNFRGRGCAYLYLRLKFDAKVWPSGLPNIWAMVKGRKILDTRTGTTAYGNNAANVAADWLTFSRLGLRTEIADTDLQAAANTSDESITLADSETEPRYTINGVCYADVAPGEYLQQMVDSMAGFCGRIGGKWYIHAGAYRTPTVTLGPDDLRAPIGSVQTGLSRTELFNAVRGVVRLPENNWQPTSFPAVRNGTYEWRVGRFSRTFTADTGTDTLTLSAAAIYEIGVGCRVSTTGTLPAPLAADTTYYVIAVDEDQIKLAATRSGAHAGTAINLTTTGSGTHTIRIGNTHWRDVEHNFVTSNGQAQRLAKIDIERTAQPISFIWPGKASCIRVKAGDNVLINYPDFGWSAKPFEVVEQKFTLDQVSNKSGLPIGYRPGEDLILRETASGIFDWNNGEETAIDLSENTNLPDPGSVAEPTALALTSNSTTTDIQADGTVIPRIKVTWTAPADQKVLAGGFIRIEYKLSAASDWRHVDRIRGDETEAYVRDIVIGQAYDVRIRAETLLAYSEWVEADTTAAGDTTAPSAPTGLTATGGERIITLDWDDITVPDLGEYGIYRHTANSFGSATKIAEVRASRFVDTTPTPGTPYYYWITAIDRSENESSPSTVNSATALDDLSDALADAAQAIADAATAQGTADGKVTTFVQASAPTAEGIGDLWLDSDDGNRLYRWNGSSWVDVQDDEIAQAIADAATAQSTADGKIVSFYQPSAPTAEGIGDLWTDTDDSNKLYRWNGSAWVSIRDTGIAQALSDASQAIADAATAQGTADGKVTTFVQTSAPTAEGIGDLWLDSDDGNRLYRWNGSSWVDVQDDQIAEAIADAATAQSTADGKVVTFYQTSAPTAEGIGDLWTDTDDGNRLYRWNGSSWVDVTGIRTNVPSTPSAPTYNSGNTYQGGDGTVFAYLQLNLPAMPSGGVILNVLYRVNGSSQWRLGDQKNAGGGTARIDDLAPGVTYQFALQAFSNFGIGSSISSVLTQAAPNKTAGPAKPTGFTAVPGNSSDYTYGPRTIGGENAFTSLLSWDAPADKDLEYYEIAVTTADSDAAANAASAAGDTDKVAASQTYLVYASLTLSARWARVRGVNSSGVPGDWRDLGASLAGYLGLPAGDMVEQSSNAVVVTAIKTGGASSREVTCRYPTYFQPTLAGGSPTETYDLNISAGGFPIKPSHGHVSVYRDDVLAFYDGGSASSTSTNARIVFYTPDGSNLPNAAVGGAVTLELYT